MDKRFSKGEAIQFGWKTLTDNTGFFIGLVLIVFLVSWLPNVVAQQFEKTAPLLTFVISIASIFVSGLVNLGVVKTSLRFVDQDKGRLEDLMAYPNLFWKYLGASILSFVAVVGGLILLIIPGIIIAVRLQFVLFYIVDQDAGVVDSLKKSFALTQGQWGELFLFGGLLFLVILAGFLCLGVGLFAALPTTWVAQAFVFRKLLATNPDAVVQAAPAKPSV